jgi:LmbE family N-acetylglucosaminyl deacetylase
VARTVVLSPHLDDAVLSCWHVLTAADEVTVVNVFAGVPESGTLGWWDRLTKATDSAERMRERRAEDVEALGLAGAAGANLDLLDEQYRRNGSPTRLKDALAERVGDADVVYAPAVLFPIPDHALVLAAALELREDVRLYADMPHAAIYGLPGWVTGQRDVLDVDAAWRGRLAEAGLHPDSLRAEVHALEDEAFEHKLSALRRYRTQLPAIEREAPLETLRWEVTWTR